MSYTEIYKIKTEGTMTPEEFEELLHDYTSEAQEAVIAGEHQSAKLGHHEIKMHQIQEQLLQAFRQSRLKNSQMKVALNDLSGFILDDSRYEDESWDDVLVQKALKVREILGA